MNRLSHTDTPIPDSRTACMDICFKNYNIRMGEKISNSDPEANHLVFLLNGELSVQYNEFQAVKVSKESFFLLPKSARYALTALSLSNLLACSFDSLHCIYNILNFRIYTALRSQIQFTFAPLPVHDALNGYIDTLVEYMKLGINTEFICRLKFQELFFLLGELYNRQEMTNLFYPILGQSPDFKNQVMQYFSTVNNVDELAKKMGMGRGNFDIKFKKEFGVTPLQWILKEKAKHVYFSLSEPENTLNDIMNKHNFSSFTHLNRFCKQQFGCSPSELRKRLIKND
jgi:AraC-like DNA-binding protein